MVHHGADVLVDLDGLMKGGEIHRGLVVELSVLGTEGEELVEPGMRNGVVEARRPGARIRTARASGFGQAGVR